MLAPKNESINQGIVTLKQLTADEKMQMQMEARERYRRDMVACEEYGRRQNAKLLAEQECTIQEQYNIIQEQEREIQLLKQQLAQQNSNNMN